MSQNLGWIGSHAVNRVFKFDQVWSTLDLFKGNDTLIYFSAKTSGPNVVLDADGFELQQIDLTNAKIAFLISDAENNDAILLTKTNGLTGGITVTDAVNGHFTILLSRDDLVNIPPGIYNAEVAYQDAITGYVHTLAKTTTNIIHSITEGIAW